MGVACNVAISCRGFWSPGNVSLDDVLSWLPFAFFSLDDV